ncbi:MAG: hypothetical protein AAGP08_10370 [Pseudomonadota bacterium]
MRRASVIKLALVVAYAALIAWHQPLRGPLSEDEVRAAFGAQFAQIRQSEDAEAQAFLGFFLEDDGRAFFMVNLNALPEQTPEVKTAARQYGLFMMTRLLPRASYPVMSTDVITSLTNSLAANLAPFERVVVVRYRSRRDFLEIVTSPAFRQELSNKTASLDGWSSAPSTAGPLFSLPVFVLLLMLLVPALYRSIPRRKRPDQKALDFKTH